MKLKDLMPGTCAKFDNFYIVKLKSGSNFIFTPSEAICKAKSDLTIIEKFEFEPISNATFITALDKSPKGGWFNQMCNEAVLSELEKK